MTRRHPIRLFAVLAVLCALAPAYTLAAAASAQQSPGVSRQDRREAEGKFFAQLRRIFGTFRNADLQQVFQEAQPLNCTELVSEDGQWREVGFFNENRGFGAWFRTSMTEIRSQLDVYTFAGNCNREDSALRVATRFPVDQSLKAHKQGQIAFRDIEVRQNQPVNAVFERRTQAYTFDLPYLFRVSDANAAPLYALSPRTASDQYAPEAVNRWECKSVVAQDVTYRFLICRTSLLLPGNGWKPDATGRTPYGTSAFSILTDGQEASASVKLTFDDPEKNRKNEN